MYRYTFYNTNGLTLKRPITGNKAVLITNSK